jgi:MFS family permease
VRAPGRVNWLAAAVMSVGMSLLLIGIAQTSVWGWGSVKSIGLMAAGLLVIGLWVLIEVRSDNPLVDMAMMRIRGVWTTNLAAFLIGAGMYAAFIVFPEFAQLPKSTGFGFGSSVVASSLYLLPAAICMTVAGSFAGGISRRFGSRAALIVGSFAAAAAFLYSALQHSHPYDILITMALLGIGMGLAFAALGNLIVGAVEPHQTGVASGMNTVMRTLGGALGGQISATFIAGHTIGGLPTVTGFTETFWMATGFLLVAGASGFLVPATRRATGRAAQPATDSLATAEREKLPADTAAA